MKNLKKYILFDNDGVLVETEKWYFEANKKSLALLGLNLEMDFYQNIMVKGGSAFELALIYNIEKDIREKHRKVRDSFYQEFLQTKDIKIPQVKDILKNAKADGIDQMRIRFKDNTGSPNNALLSVDTGQLAENGRYLKKYHISSANDVSSASIEKVNHAIVNEVLKSLE